MSFDSKDTIKKSVYTPFIQWNKQGVTSPIEKNNIKLFNFENKNNDGLVIEHSRKKKSEPSKQIKINSLQERIAKTEQELKKAENSNGLLGKTWSWFKNKTDRFLPVDSSNKVRKQLEIEKQKIKDIQKPEVFKELTGVEYSEENYSKFEQGEIKLLSEQKLEGYKEGQEIAVDITSDIVSGVVAYGAAAACIAGGIAAAPFTAGASLGAVAVGVGIAAGAGVATKVAIKAGEAAVGGKKYNTGWKDAAIGTVSGALAPVTIGAGGAVASFVGKVATKAVTSKFVTSPLKLVKAGSKITKFVTEKLPGFVANTAKFSAEGGMFGFADGGTRSTLEGESIGDVGLNALKSAGIGAGSGFVLGHCINTINNIPKTQLAKDLPLSFKNKINGLLDKISYKPSVEKLRKCATKVEDFGDHEKLFIKYHSADPIIFNNNQGLGEIKDILIKHNLLSDDNIAMFANAKLAFNTIPELKGRSIKAYLGHGGFSFAFLLDNNVVLKITKNDIIDSKVLSRNIRQAFDNTLEAPTRQIGIIDNKTYSIQEFGVPTTNKIAFRKLSNDLRQRGVTKFDIDWCTRQCARFKDARPTLWGRINPFGTLKVVDLGCIHPPETL